MRRTITAFVAAVAVLGAGASGAQAARVIVLGPHGRVTSIVDRTVPSTDLPRSHVRARPARAAHVSAHAAAPRTAGAELARLYRSRAIDAASYQRYHAILATGLKAARGLSGTRAAELDAVLQNLHDIAVAGKLTPSRLPVLFLTLDRNRQWWSSGPLLADRERVEFKGSTLVWEYYAGQGIELQELGSFGKAQWDCSHPRKDGAECREMLSELVPLASRRAGGLVWEYFFDFDGGAPPWTSAMSQGTALQALADAYRGLHDSTYLTTAKAALPVFGAAPPAGVGVRTALGMRYVQYSFAAAASEDVINGFLQSLIGLADYAHTSGDPVAARLFALGDAEARAEVPRFDTGGWSLYQPGQDDDLNYHELVTSFLAQLCGVTHAPVYCQTAANFERDLKAPAALSLLTRKLTARAPSLVYFTVSKPARVGVTVLHRDRVLFLTSAQFSHGEHAFALPALAPAGTYTIRLDSTDLAGNYGQQPFTVDVVRHR